ncbi:Cof-type HAD-IIB family hydrolase [uncultured Sphaerochaeta sp.]|uniref:Cof-type HAD-IIB family hydrolase n=1 Tax=uncultured Sphaerochaeta sp. TaxID=886478 RepID=UPI002A0A873D|nr:Cof-type HAD-IIB family hydrolase [uncultured Sphaerochaeta sp.]
MSYSVLALDLDGTLTDSQKRVSPASKAAIHAAIGQGVAVVLASGRPMIGIKPVAQELDLFNLGGFIISYNGAKILNCKTGVTVFERTIRLEEILTTLNFARLKDLAFVSYDKNGIITDHPDDPYVGKEAFNNAIPIRYVPNLEQTILEAQPKVMIVGKPELLAPAQKDLQELLGSRATVAFSEPCFMEITARGIQKASSLDILLSLLGKNRSDLMVIGDGLNDIPMFDIAGLAVAMENSQEETKKHAHVHTASNDNDGVALAIERYIL